MHKSVKIMFALWAALLVFGLVVACEKHEEEENIPAAEDFIAEQPIEMNIYCHGIKNTIDMDDIAAEDMLSAFEATLAYAQNNRDMKEPVTGLGADELLNRHISLELLFADSTQTLLEDPEGGYVSAQGMLYSINTNGKGKNTLCVDGMVFRSVEELDMAELLEKYAFELQQPNISRGMAHAANMQVPYLAEVSSNINDDILGPIIYNTLAFYRNCNNYNFDGNTGLLTEDFRTLIEMTAAGEITENDRGADIALHMTNYMDYDATPASLQVVTDGHYGDYIAYLTVDDVNTLQVVFMVVDGYPLIDACYLMVV